MPLRLRLLLMKRGRPKHSQKDRLPNGKVDHLQGVRKREYRPRRRQLMPSLHEIKEECVETFSPWMDYAVFRNIQDFFQIFFGEEYRRIREYQVEDAFIIPKEIPFKGYRPYAPSPVWSPTESLRKVSKGDCILLRTDIREPHVFEVQILSSIYLDESDARIFIMGPREFYDIRKNIQLLGGG